MSNASCQWIIVPEDGFTNEVIARELAADCAAAGNETSFVDNKSKRHKGYIVEHAFITTLAKQKSSNLKYKIFSREGAGAYRQSHLHKMKRRSKKVKEIQEMLKNVKK